MSKCIPRYRLTYNLCISKQYTRLLDKHGCLASNSMFNRFVSNSVRGKLAKYSHLSSSQIYTKKFYSQRAVPNEYSEELTSDSSSLCQEKQPPRKVCQSGTTEYLYIPQRALAKTNSILQPHMDFSAVFRNLNEVVANLRLRGSNVDLPYLQHLKESSERFHYILTSKERLQAHEHAIKRFLKSGKMSVGEQFVEGVDIAKASEVEIRNLRRHLRDRIKVLKRDFEDLEVEVVPELLGLPNTLSEETKQMGTKIDYFNEKPYLNRLSRPHWALKDASTGEDLLTLSTVGEGSVYFLSHNAAQLDMALGDMASRRLEGKGFLPHVNPDFVRGALVEACCMLNHRQTAGSSLAELPSIESAHPVRTVGDKGKDHVTPLMLAGGASLPAYMGYFTKSTVTNLSKFLPQKLYCVGKLYTEPLPDASAGVFTSMQSSSVSCLILDTKENLTFEQDAVSELLGLVQEVYGSLGVHYRIVTLPPQGLRQHEKRAYSVQMITTCNLTEQAEFSDQPDTAYIEVGRISVCGDFLSRRLYMTYQREKVSGEEKRHDFLQCVFGELMNVSRVIAVAAENSQDCEGSCDVEALLTRVEDA